MLLPLAFAWQVLNRRLDAAFGGRNRDRGDVPGWVLITLMTAGIVTALWVVAEPAMKNILTSALNISGDPNN